MILLLALGVLSLLGAVVIGGAVWWFASNKDRFAEEGKRTMAEAAAFAATHEQTECVDEGLRKIAACDGFVCEGTAKLFTTSCIRQAQPTPGFCDGVPDTGEVVKASRWVVAECQRRGEAGNQRCGRLAQSVPEACHVLKSAP